jgi:hypothetical protein
MIEGSRRIDHRFSILDHRTTRRLAHPAAAGTSR